MKNVILRIFVALVLVLSSISVCLSDDNGCDDRTSYSQSKSPDSPSKPLQAEDHHCMCSLSCNNLFIDTFSTVEKVPSTISSSVVFSYTQTPYPPVFLSLDKPPII